MKCISNHFHARVDSSRACACALVLKVSTIFAFVLDLTQDGLYNLVLAKEIERTVCDLTFRNIF
jgi:hypothetical protein